ncbi:MAG: hypothetical protein U9R29_10350 [Thermodesulfobacteriota bacterium]|nr:hypothetical protein [Thermodesulfobacteriota bacterium]
MICRFTLLPVLLLVITLTGCGNVGPVQPLRKALPEAVSNVTLQQKGTALLLSWDIPTRNQDGSELNNLDGFAIYKSDYDLVRGCPECRPPKKLLRKIDLSYYRSSNRSSERIYLWDSAVDEETGYRYKIVPYTSDGLEGNITLLHRPCFTAPYPPTDLSGTGLDRQARLSWQAADESRQGVKVLGYNIYRRSGGDYFAANPLNNKPLTVLRYDDLNVENNINYNYALRTVITIGERQLESSLCTEAQVQPQRP